MNKEQIIDAIQKGTTLIWMDPSPISGNEYRIKKVIGISEEIAVIQYGGIVSASGCEHFSEAEVPLEEIDYAFKHPTEQMIKDAKEILRHAGFILQVWSADDVLNIFEERDCVITRKEAEEVVEAMNLLFREDDSTTDSLEDRWKQCYELLTGGKDNG